MGGSSQPALKCSKLESGALGNTLGWWAQAACQSQLSPCQQGRGLSCPIPLFQQGEIPSFLIDFLGAHCPQGTWKLLIHNGWSRVAEELPLARVQSGFCRPPRPRGAAHSTYQRSQCPVQAGGTSAAAVHHSPAARCCRLVPALRGTVLCPSQHCPEPECQGGQPRQREVPKAAFLHIPMVLFQCLVWGWVSWWRGRVLAVGCHHQKSGIGVFRHNFLNSEQQSNSGTQPPPCKVAPGWCCNFPGCL